MSLGIGLGVKKQTTLSFAKVPNLLEEQDTSGNLFSLA